MTNKYNADGLNQCFFKLIHKWPEARYAVNRLTEEGDLLLFGGAVREYLDHGFKKLPRDFDIVVKTDNIILDDYLYDIPYVKNRYGGYKICTEDVQLDVWTLPSTWAFREQKVQAATEENLTKTVFLNYDAVVYNLCTGHLYAEGYNQAIEDKTLDIVLSDNPYPGLNILRAFVFRRKKKLSFSAQLRNYILNWVDTNDNYIYDLLSIQKKHYGKEYLTREQMIYEIDQLKD